MAIELYQPLDADFKSKIQTLESPDQDNLHNRILRCTNNMSQGCIAGVYITTNESNVDESRIALVRKPKIAHACHIGFSGWHNFDIMASRHSEYGLICDFNPNNKKFIEMTLFALKSTRSRKEFLEKMMMATDRIAQVFDFFSPNVSKNFDGYEELLLPSEEILSNARQEGSWLFSDGAFNYIKQLALDDKITAVTEDIRNTETFQKLVKLFHEEGLTIDTVYTSNICDYMHTNADKEAYVSTIYSLIEPQTTLIHCPIDRSVRLQQQVVLGGELLKNREDISGFFKSTIVEDDDIDSIGSSRELVYSPDDLLEEQDDIFFDALTSQNSLAE